MGKRAPTGVGARDELRAIQRGYRRALEACWCRSRAKAVGTLDAEQAVWRLGAGITLETWIARNEKAEGTRPRHMAGPGNGTAAELTKFRECCLSSLLFACTSDDSQQALKRWKSSTVPMGDNARRIYVSYSQEPQRR